MELSSAISLADFINERSRRYHAKVLSFGSNGWVIVADREDLEGTDSDSLGSPHGYLEPIADPRDYVNRARKGILLINREYRCLVEEWLEKNFLSELVDD